MSQSCDCPFARLVLVGALAAAFALAGCGRKGPLDLPPASSLTGEAHPAAANAAEKQTNSGIGADGKPIAAKGENKRVPLDGLLN